MTQPQLILMQLWRRGARDGGSLAWRKRARSCTRVSGPSWTRSWSGCGRGSGWKAWTGSGAGASPCLGSPRHLAVAVAAGRSTDTTSWPSNLSNLWSSSTSTLCINWEHRYLLAMAHDLLRYNSKHQSAQKSLPLFLTIGLKVFSPSLHVTPNAKLRAGHWRRF